MRKGQGREGFGQTRDGAAKPLTRLGAIPKLEAEIQGERSGLATGVEASRDLGVFDKAGVVTRFRHGQARRVGQGIRHRDGEVVVVFARIVGRARAAVGEEAPVLQRVGAAVGGNERLERPAGQIELQPRSDLIGLRADVVPVVFAAIADVAELRVLGDVVSDVDAEQLGGAIEEPDGRQAILTARLIDIERVDH